MRAKSAPTLLAAGLGFALLASPPVAAPAFAQSFSAGYEFLKAVRERDGDVVTETLEQPGSTIVNTRDITTGESALHIVTQRRDLTWIRFLAGKGANPNVEDRNGTTPLQAAVNLGFIEGVEALLKAGAKADVTNAAGETPLISAVHRRDVAMVRLLLKYGGNLDRNDNSGRSARDYAALAAGNGQLLEAFAEADKDRAGKSADYGPAIR